MVPKSFSPFDTNDTAFLSERFLGCWMGKNCGGTLGGPWEDSRGWGYDEPFSVTGYTGDVEGGLPNDDLELQMIWLRMLEERGIDFTEADFVPYWLGYIHYNPDEYGILRDNLKLGLAPSIAGFHNNPFRDCMGSPIRTEIWACLAAGNPRLAARYAVTDARLDHPGGEGVYGSLFNVALQAAGFVLSDRDELLDLALLYVPEGCLVHRCVETARAAHREGVDWQEARRRVIAVGGAYNCQFAPTNMGLQTVAWLYNREFGETILMAVNCGFDTDCTGATIGALLGILDGGSALPAKWTAPLGAGIRYNDAIYPTGQLPHHMDDLNQRLLALRGQVVARHGGPVAQAEDLLPDDSIRAMWEQSPTAITFRDAQGVVAFDYHTQPTLRPGATRKISVSLRPDYIVPEGVEVTARGTAAEGLEVRSTPLTREDNEWRGEIEITVPAKVFAEAKTLYCQPVIPEYPVLPSMPLTLVPERPWWRYWDRHAEGDAPAFDAAKASEATPLPDDEAEVKPGEWQLVTTPEELVRWDWPEGAKRLHLRTAFELDAASEGRFKPHADVPREAWLNGERAGGWAVPQVFRPSPVGDDVVECRYRAGRNEAAVTLQRGDGKQVRFYIRLMDGKHQGLHMAKWTAA